MDDSRSGELLAPDFPAAERGFDEVVVVRNVEKKHRAHKFDLALNPGAKAVRPLIEVEGNCCDHTPRIELAIEGVLHRVSNTGETARFATHEDTRVLSVVRIPVQVVAEREERVPEVHRGALVHEDGDVLGNVRILTLESLPNLGSEDLRLALVDEQVGLPAVQDDGDGRAWAVAILDPDRDLVDVPEDVPVRGTIVGAGDAVGENEKKHEELLRNEVNTPDSPEKEV